jgi:hypothetical protein
LLWTSAADPGSKVSALWEELGKGPEWHRKKIPNNVVPVNLRTHFFRPLLRASFNKGQWLDPKA